MNAEFQKIARRDKKAFLSDQCKEIEENNRMEKTRDLFKKIRDTKGAFHVRSDQSLSCVRLFATPGIAACQASLSLTNSRSSLILRSIESVVPSNHLILCCPLHLLPSVFPSTRGKHLLCVSMDSPILDISYKWCHTICDLLCLASGT